MKSLPVLSLIVLLAGAVVCAAAQSSADKKGKVNPKPDEYMTNQFYQTKPLTEESKGVKGSGKKSKHHDEHTRPGNHKPAGTIVPGSDQKAGNSGKVTSDVPGKRVHQPLVITHKRK